MLVPRNAGAVMTEVYTANSLEQLEDVLGQVFDSIAIEFQEIDYTPPLTEALVKLEEQHEAMYSGGHDSNGDAWPPLAPSTVKRKGHATILVDSGRMKASLVGQSGDSIRDVVSEGGSAGAVFGTDVEYAHFHVDGTARMPARPPVGISEETIGAVTNAIADHTVASIKR